MYQKKLPLKDLFVAHESDDLPSGVDTLIFTKLKYWKGSQVNISLNKNYNNYTKLSLSKVYFKKLYD